MRIVLNPDPYWSLSQLKLMNSLWGVQYAIIIKARQQGKTEFCSKLLSHVVVNDNQSPVRRNFCSMNTLDQCNKVVIPRFKQQLGALEESGIFKLFNVQGSTGREMILEKPWIGPGCKSITHFTGMGNKDAIRGGSYHFMYCDEVEQYPPGTVTDILMPMTTETGGIMILTGTVKSFGEFYKKGMNYKKWALEDKTFLFWDDDVFTCENFTDRVIKNMYRNFCAEQNEPGFWGEFMNNPLKAASKKNPFTLKLANLRKQTDYSTMHHKLVNINLDRGLTAGHMPYMAWQYDMKNDPLALDYSRTDLTDLFMIPDFLVKRYGHFDKINLIFPYDICNPSSKHGYTQFDLFQSMIYKKGLSEKFCLNILPKIERDGKVVVINTSIEGFNRWKFLMEEEGVQDLVMDIAQIAFRLVEKTKFFDYRKPVENDYIHVLDMFLYANMSLDLEHTWNPIPQVVQNKDRILNYFDGRLY